MTEISSLIERAKKYLSSAALLIQARDYESAVSRTYYAMFYTAQAVLLTKDLSFSSHSSTISNFGKEFVKTGIFSRDMGRELNRAFQKRQIGDYTHTFTITEDEAKQLLNTGKDFVEKVEDYLQDTRFL